MGRTVFGVKHKQLGALFKTYCEGLYLAADSETAYLSRLKWYDISFILGEQLEYLLMSATAWGKK